MKNLLKPTAEWGPAGRPRIFGASARDTYDGVLNTTAIFVNGSEEDVFEEFQLWGRVSTPSSMSKNKKKGVKVKINPPQTLIRIKKLNFLITSIQKNVSIDTESHLIASATTNLLKVNARKTGGSEISPSRLPLIDEESHQQTPQQNQSATGQNNSKYNWKQKLNKFVENERIYARVTF